jgi:hypothetical protein
MFPEEHFDSSMTCRSVRLSFTRRFSIALLGPLISRRPVAAYYPRPAEDSTQISNLSHFTKIPPSIPSLLGARFLALLEIIVTLRVMIFGSPG